MSCQKDKEKRKIEQRRYRLKRKLGRKLTEIEWIKCAHKPPNKGRPTVRKMTKSWRTEYYRQRREKIKEEVKRKEKGKKLDIAKERERLLKIMG